MGEIYCNIFFFVASNQQPDTVIIGGKKDHRTELPVECIALIVVFVETEVLLELELIFCYRVVSVDTFCP